MYIRPSTIVVGTNPQTIDLAISIIKAKYPGLDVTLYFNRYIGGIDMLNQATLNAVKEDIKWGMPEEYTLRHLDITHEEYMLYNLALLIRYEI